MAVLIQADITLTNLWGRGRFGPFGTLLDGGTNGNIPMLSAPAHPDDPDPSDGNLVSIRMNASGAVTINDDGGLELRDYFGDGGAGNDLRLYFQTAADGVAYATVSDTGVIGTMGGNYANFTLHTGTADVVQGIEGDERFIFALAREAPDNPPQFAAAKATRSVPENSSASANVGATISYSLGGSSLFTVTSGEQIQVASGASLNHEYTDEYTVTLTATDNLGATDAIEVTISVGDVNEAPEFDDTAVTFPVDENSRAGTNVGSPLGVTDPDDGDTVTLTDNSAQFDVTSSGQVQVAAGATLDHEDTGEYTFTVTATDSGPPPLTDTVRVTVSINDVDERPQLSPAPGTLSPTVNSNQKFALSNITGISQVRVTRTNGTGRLVLNTAEAGLS